VLHGKDANVYGTLIALYLLTNQAPIRGLGIGSLAKAP